MASTTAPSLGERLKDRFGDDDDLVDLIRMAEDLMAAAAPHLEMSRNDQETPAAFPAASTPSTLHDPSPGLSDAASSWSLGAATPHA